VLETNEAQFDSLGDGEAAEGEEDAVEPDEAGLIGESKKMGPRSPTSSQMTRIMSRRGSGLKLSRDDLPAHARTFADKRD
jgi:hypothetical protein